MHLVATESASQPNVPIWRSLSGMQGTATLRRSPQEFKVAEDLGFEPSGDGEHDFLYVQKVNRTTADVVRALSAYAGVARRDIGFSGMKDRRAVTRQWFSVKRPAGKNLQWDAYHSDQIEILSAGRHRRKLRRGTHRRNDFRIVLADVVGDGDAIDTCLHSIALDGAPNYFGPQRFGRGGANLVLAARLFSGERLKRELRGFAVSAARSAIFNDLLERRIEAATWNKLVPGDIANLDGSRSIFPVEGVDETLGGRCQAADVHPTGPLWGRGSPETQGEIAAAEQAAADGRGALRAGLEACATADRRALRMRVHDLDWSWEGRDLHLSFALGRGSFATSIVNELVSYTD